VKYTPGLKSQGTSLQVTNKSQITSFQFPNDNTTEYNGASDLFCSLGFIPGKRIKIPRCNFQSEPWGKSEVYPKANLKKQETLFRKSFSGQARDKQISKNKLQFPKGTKPRIYSED
jgi:hypothetical protein